MSDTQQAMSSAGKRGLSGLSLAILAYRWVVCSWMTFNILTIHNLLRPRLAWTAVGIAVVWTAWITIAKALDRPWVLWLDLVLSFVFVLGSGYALRRGTQVGTHPFFASAYPASTVLMWASAWGAVPGMVSGIALSAALVLSRPINDVSLSHMSSLQLQTIGSGVVYYITAGGAVGLVSRQLAKTAGQVRRANEEAVREREAAARLAERDALARRIHDSVLQVLALVHKRARELAARENITPAEVNELANLAGQQEEALRALIAREPEEAPTGSVSLRDALEGVATDFRAVPTTVSVTGPIWLPAGHVGEIAAAVRQALDNVTVHAHATRAFVFAEEQDGHVNVSVRDDGIGFVFDEQALRASGKLGILASMKGRVEDLGGTIHIATAPNKGTEVEFQVPTGGGGA